MENVDPCVGLVILRPVLLDSMTIVYIAHLAGGFQHYGDPAILDGTDANPMPRACLTPTDMKYVLCV
jgi:hypothetical protein